MSRRMGAEHTKMYRAVIDRALTDGRSLSTVHHGPYLTKGQATAAIARAKRCYWPASGTSAYRIEETTLEWQPVTDEPGQGKVHTDSAGVQYVNTGDGTEAPWVRLGRLTYREEQWFSWEGIRDL